MSISKIRESARTALTGKWGKGACITLAYVAFAFAVGFVIGLCGDSLMADLLDLAYSIIQVPILFGIAYAFIKLKRNEEVKAFDFLNLGFSNFGRAWKIGLREVVKVLLPLLLMIVSIVIFIGAGVYSTASATINMTTNDSSSVFIVVGLILYVISIIWFVARSLLYSLTTYIAYDNPSMSSLEVVNESARMMKGNRGKIFLLSLSFIGWAILTIFTLGIGYLWLLPYMMVAEVCFYDYLLGKNENNNTENNEEVITEM